jgi:hypothetical protein
MRRVNGISLCKTSISGENERVILVTSPTEGKRVSTAEVVERLLRPAKEKGATWKVYEQNNREALLSWQVGEHEFVLNRVILTPYALHIIGYYYNGNELETVPQDAWIAFLKSAKIV